MACWWLARGLIMRDMLLLAAEVALAVVPGTAGLSKLADPVGTRESMRAFGAPSRAAAGLALGVPVAELSMQTVPAPGLPTIQLKVRSELSSGTPTVT
jgi:uncharacterized membrane protein YphA (DoxX/SURF4 family)